MGARPQHSIVYRKFCKMLRKWRSEANLSQRALASALGKPPSYVHKVEVADRRLDPLEFIQWCVGCGREPESCLADIRRNVGLTKVMRPRARK